MEKKGVGAAKGDLTQLHVMDTWVPKDPAMLSRTEKVKALSSLMFLKEKNSGKVEERACVNGAPQRAYIRKEDVSSPTFSNESVFITLVIAACENALCAAMMYRERFSTQNMMRIY